MSIVKMGYSRKNPHPHDGRHGFLTPIQLDSGFLIEGGTRRFITTYFGIYSHLLCVSVAFLCFVLFLLQVCLSCFRIALLFLVRLWSKQNWINKCHFTRVQAFKVEHCNESLCSKMAAKHRRSNRKFKNLLSFYTYKNMIGSILVL